jgi:hypothetical protein
VRTITQYNPERFNPGSIPGREQSINNLNYRIMTEIKVKEMQAGGRYHVCGDIENGFKDGKPYICHEEVTRVVTRITDTHIICECGRKFLINGNLKIREI